jgi:YHS domain-containing protein
MAKAMDVVCGMMVETSTAPAKSVYKDEVFYFCSPECRNRFEGNPAHYASKESRDRLAASLHNPVFPTPRFGSAASGGAEFESVPPLDERGVD